MNPLEAAFWEPQRFHLIGAIRESHRMTCARPSDSGKLPAFKPMELSADQFEIASPGAMRARVENQVTSKSAGRSTCPATSSPCPGPGDFSLVDTDRAVLERRHRQPRPKARA